MQLVGAFAGKAVERPTASQFEPPLRRIPERPPELGAIRPTAVFVMDVLRTISQS
jgi:hypothetical protein